MRERKRVRALARSGSGPGLITARLRAESIPGHRKYSNVRVRRTGTWDPVPGRTALRRNRAGALGVREPMPNRRPTLLLVALLAVAACTPTASPSGSPAPSPSPTSAPPGAIEHPTGPTDIVLRYDEGGGFVPAEFFVTALPIFTLYGDGSILFRNPDDQPAADENFFLRHNPLKAAKLSEAQIQEVLEFAISQGGLGVAREQYDNPMMADVGSAIFTLRAGGREKTVTVVGLTEGGAEGPDAIARKAFLTLAQRLRNFDDGGTYPTVAYDPPAYRAILQEVTGVVAKTRPWPWANLKVADFPTPKDPNGALVFPQRVLTPSEVAEIGLGDLRGGALGIYLDGPNGKQYSLALRPLLPGETS